MVTVPAPDQCPDKPRNGLSEPGSAWACAEMSKSPDASTAGLRQLAEGFKVKKAMTFAFQFPSHGRSGICQLPHAATFTLAPALSHDLQKQRDEFALAMRVRLGKDGFQLIARRLP